MCFALSLAGPRWPAALAVAVLLAMPLTPALAAPGPDSVLAFTDVAVVDVASGRLLQHQTVVVAGARIRTMGRTGAVRVPPGARRVVARGRYLIPGLWDMHVHMWGSGASRFFPAIQYPLYIANGVTGIRSLNVPCLDVALQWRRDIAAGQRVGPRQFLSGPALDGGDGAVGVEQACGHTSHLGIPTPARAQLVVDSLRAAGVDLIKVYQPSREVYFAIAAAARRAGLRFGGHMPDFRPRPSMLEVSDGGQRIVDHMGGGLPIGCDSLAECRRTARHLRRNGTWLSFEISLSHDLTDSLYRSRLRYWPDSIFQSLDSGRAAERKALEERLRAERPWRQYEQADLPLVTGTDAAPSGGESPGFSLVDVVIGLVDGGVTPFYALQAATINAARALGAADSLGTVAPGKLADFVLLDGDPLAEITNLRRVRAVVANGRYFDRAGLDSVLADVERVAHP